MRCDLEKVHYVGKLSTQQGDYQATLFTASYDGVVGFAFVVYVCPRWMDVLEQCTPAQRQVTMRNVRGGTSLHVGPDSEVLRVLPTPARARRPKTAPPAKKNKRRPREDGEWLPEKSKK